MQKFFTTQSDAANCLQCGVQVIPASSLTELHAFRCVVHFNGTIHTETYRILATDPHNAREIARNWAARDCMNRTPAAITVVILSAKEYNNG